MKDLLKRILGKRDPADPALTPPRASRAERTGWLRDHIRRDVASGFYDEDTILTNAVAAFEDEFDMAELRPTAQRLLRTALADHAEARKTWPPLTDCDRLDEAFAALEAKGVVARQNFTCCGTCGATEIWDEVDAVADAGGPTRGPVRGYAFYHMQDTESAADGHGLCLNYGACEDGEPAALAVARDIVAELKAHGLQTDWDGTWGQRISVSLDWKRRR